MRRSFFVASQGRFQGQILLERALFCVGCEVVFTGTTRCPRCSSLEAVWPLAEWLRSTRSSAMVSVPHLRPGLDESPVPCQQQPPSAA